MMSKLRANNSGFTLTEIIVAAVVFSIAVSGIFSVINYVGRQQEQQVSSTEEVQAALFGQQVLEELRSCVNNSGGMGTGGCLEVGNDYVQTSSDGKYTATFNIIDSGGGRQVQMDVTWN